MRQARHNVGAAHRPLTGSSQARRPKLLDQLRQALRSRPCSRRAEQTYCHWARPFIFFHHVRHPAEMAEPEINAFMTDPSVKQKVRDKWPMALVMYGAGLRLMECLHLRVQDIDFAANQITVRDDKGFRGRATMLPEAARESLQQGLKQWVLGRLRQVSRGESYAADGHGGRLVQTVYSLFDR